jgi:hypothetical protein
VSDDSQRITVSLDTLRNELSQLELRIVDRIASALELKADKTVVAEHDKRIAQLELSRAAREHLSKDLLDLERRVGEVETVNAGEAGASNYRRWLLPAFATVAGSLWWIPVLLGHG